MKAQDLTIGSTKKLILAFALPTLFSNLFQQFYNLADTAIAGHILGDSALVAIGASSSIYSLIFTFAFGLNGGFGIVIAQAFGAKDIKKLKRTVAHSLAINITLASIVAVLSLVIINPVLRLMNTPSEVIGDAYSYIIIILLTIIIPMLYNLEFTILRSLGDSKTPLYFLIVSSVLNIALDYILIKYMHTGVMGAALATAISQLVVLILCFVVIKRNFDIIKLSKNDYQLDKSLLKSMLSAGMTMAMMNSIFSIGSIIMQGSINALGSTVIAAHLASRKLCEMLMQPLVTIGTACSTFVSQNYGAKKYPRISEGIRWSEIYALIVSIFSFILLFFFGGKLAGLITGTKNAEVISYASMYIRINVPFYFVLGTLFILRFSIQSINKKIPPLISSSMELGCKLIAAFILIPKFGYIGACVAEPASWCMGAIFLLFMFKNAYKEIKAHSN